MRDLDNKFKGLGEFFKDNNKICISYAIFIVLHLFWEKLITKGLVNTVFCNIESTLINDVIFCIIVISIILTCIVYVRKNYSISSKYILISILIVTILTYYRVNRSPWLFTSFYLLNWIKYIDVVILFFISSIVIRLMHKKRKYEAESSKGFAFDTPITERNQDIYKRNDTGIKISEIIKNTANHQSSFAIGISSEWGQGKTSFLNLINNNLNEDNRIIINFNPWLNNDEKAIIRSFFDELSSRLKKYNKDLSAKIVKYASVLNMLGSESIKIDRLFSLTDNKIDLRGRFLEINEAIKKSGFQIVIFIDDLDRLYENEAIEVLKLIRNSANFANTIFIVAYDRNYLISALRKVNQYHPDFYLEKIFQIEISLPAFEQEVIEDKLKELLFTYLSDKDKKELDEILERSKQYLSLFSGNYFDLKLIKNIREANRFVNSFMIAYSALKGEIVLLDLLNLELLRINYLGVYNLLAKDYNSFLTQYTYQATKSFLSLAKIKNDKGEDMKQTKLEEYLKTNFLEVGIDKNQINEAIKYVYNVFPHYEYFPNLTNNHLSIANPLFIDRYFHYNLLKSDLSEIEFSKYRDKSKEEFQEKIKFWVDQGLSNEVKIRLENIELFLNKDDYEKIIESILLFSSITKGREFDINNLHNKLSFKKVSVCYTNQDEFQEFVSELLFNQSPLNIYVSEFINKIFTIGLNWNFILSEEKLKNIQFKRFKEYSDKIDKIDKVLFWLYHYCNYKKWDRPAAHYKELTIENLDAKAVFITVAKRLPESFFKNIITKDYSNNDDSKTNLYGILKTILKIWETWESFETFMNEFNEKNVKGLSEFKDFYTKCKTNNFNYIEYNFVEIDLQNALLF